MANIKAAKKHIRTSAKRTEVNKKRKSVVKTNVKRFNDALENDNIEEAEELIKVIDKNLKKAVHQNIIHDNAASRKLSNLTKKLNNAM